MTVSENDRKFQQAVEAYIKRFGYPPMFSPDGGDSADAIMHAALTGIDLDGTIAPVGRPIAKDGQ